MQNIKLNIAGMTCVNCSNAIERVTKKISGVIDAKVKKTRLRRGKGFGGI